MSEPTLDPLEDELTRILDPLEDELTRILEPWDWDDFECKEDGHRCLCHSEVGKNIHDYYLRVGLFLKRPMRVIIAEGKFVRMKEETEYSTFLLVTLDPVNAKDQLYDTWTATGTPTKTWRPFAQQTQQPGYGGHYVTSSVSPGLGQWATNLPTTWSLQNQQQYVQSYPVTIGSGGGGGAVSGVTVYGNQGAGGGSAGGLGHVPSLPGVK